ncbi:MAG TPA: alpha/beta hydrolase-fold protein [Rhodanobacteraceae bacterium]|nr:alpha/beta hydrolase-fold protein [Rhodanobacteraceae bacterium]
MRKISTAIVATGWVLLALPAIAAAATAPTAPPHRFMHVTLGTASTQPVSGRLLVFAEAADVAKKQAKGGVVTRVDTSPFSPKQVSVAALDVDHLQPGATIDIDTDAIAFPAGFSALKPGAYVVQAVLDVNHDYNYSGRGAGDLVSDVTPVTLGADTVPTLTLAHVLPSRAAWEMPAMAPQKMRDAVAATRKDTSAIDFVSPALSAFWGRSMHMKGWVLTPPDYAAHPHDTYPTVYFTHGYGGSADSLVYMAAYVHAAMAKGDMPPMIWVFLDESSPTGTHEFADSVNNGPWGQALTTELIPHLEARYRMDAKASGRFLNGHSSGGWATLWLQVRYPKVFGGTWSTSPDPSDFHDFTGPDLYAANANVYRKPDGSLWPLVRNKGKVIATFEDFAKLERVIGPYGGQMASFEWVFSPRGADGRPMPMFDRDTGAVDPAVVAYWRDHYDIAHRLQTMWPQLKPDLDGKIHVIVGTADTFYLDGAAHRLKAVLNGLHAKAEVKFLPGRTHFDLYQKGDDRMAMLKDIAWAMYHVARPDAAMPATATAP